MSFLIRCIAILIAITTCYISAFSQEDFDPNAPKELGTGVKRAYVGEYYFVDETGDSVTMIVIRDVNCFPKLKFSMIVYFTSNIFPNICTFPRLTTTFV